MRVKIVKNTLFFAIFLYFINSHSHCHSWLDFEHSDWLRAEFFARYTFSVIDISRVLVRLRQTIPFFWTEFRGEFIKSSFKTIGAKYETAICDCSTASHWSICRPALFFLWYFLLNHSIFKKKRVIHIISSFVF